MPFVPKDSHGRGRTLGGATAIIALAAAAGPGRAAEMAEDFTASLTGGETQIASDQMTNNGQPTFETGWMPTLGVRAGARVRVLGARSTTSVGYGFGLVRFYNTPDVTVSGLTLTRYTTSHEALIASDQTLSARHRLVLTLNGSVYSLAALPIEVSVMAPQSAPASASTDTRLLTLGAGESWTYEPSGANRYLQLLAVGYTRSLDDAAAFPETLQILASERGETQRGTTIYSLTVQLGDLIRLDTPPAGTTSAFVGTHVYTSQVLAGLGRELSPTTKIEAQGGVMALYSPSLGTVAVGPAGAATLTYRRNLWYGALGAAHGPALNGYTASAVVSDSVSARAWLPLNRPETLTISGGGGYAYARSVTAGNGTSNGFYNTSKLYDVVSVAGYLSYQFTSAPLGISLEYSLLDQRGYVNPDASAPSIRRRYLGIAMSGNLSTDRRPSPEASVR